MRFLRLFCILLLVFAFMFSFGFGSYGLYYSDEYPSYLVQNGVIYIEVERSALGKGSIVLPVNTQENTFCFGSDGRVYNLSSSTINAVFYPAGGGASGTLRCTASGTFEYRHTVGATQTWSDFGNFSVLNSNVMFVDRAGRDTQNDTFRLANYEKILLTLISLDLLFTVICTFSKLRRSFYD